MRCRLFAWAPLLAFWLIAAPLRAEVTVPVTENLAADGELARDRNLPLLLMFYAEHCSYCTVVEEEFLEPMLKSGDYTDKVVIRRLDLGDRGTIIDFDGNRSTAADIGARYKVRVTPTLVYVDGQGRMVAPNMVGLTTPDFYGGYIDRHIATALDALREDPVRAAAREIPGRNLD